MIHRCHGKNVHPRIAQYYKDKGIVVCDGWRESFEEFEKWAIKNGYNDDMTIDRIDSDKNYCPENCQWITKSENSKKALDDWRKKPITEHRSEVGHFMVVEKIKKRYGRHEFDMYKVIRTGLYKQEANMLAKELNRDLPKFDHRYMARVTKNCKLGQTVFLESTGLFLNSKK